MGKTNTNLSKYDDFRKYSVEEIGNMLGIGKTKTRELLQSRLLPLPKSDEITLLLRQQFRTF